MNRFSPPFQAYIILVIASGAAVLGLNLPGELHSSQWVLLATLAASGILAGMYTLPMVYGRLRIDLSGAVLLMAVLLDAPSLAILLAAIVALVAGVLLRRRRLWNTLFNAGTEVLGIGLACLLYRGYADPSRLPLDSLGNALALVIASGSYWALNSALVTVLVVARSGESFLGSYLKNWSEFYLQCILLTLIAVLGSSAWHQGPIYALLLFVPTVAIYQLLSLSRLKQEQVIHAAEIIAEMLDRRDPFTFQHSKRVAEHAVKIARSLGLTAADTEAIHRAALIHDIGKLGVDDPVDEFIPTRAEITDYQFYSLKQHAQLGAMIAREIPAFEEAEETIKYHHDWYDGAHVSKAHSLDEIPLGARIVAVADSYDLLCMSNGDASLVLDPKAISVLGSMSGRQLDPALLGIFLRIIEAEQAAFAGESAVQPVAVG